jgi:hypothetical protein
MQSTPDVELARPGVPQRAEQTAPNPAAPANAHGSWIIISELRFITTLSAATAMKLAADAEVHR